MNTNETKRNSGSPSDQALEAIDKRDWFRAAALVLEAEGKGPTWSRLTDALAVAFETGFELGYQDGLDFQ